MPQKSSLLSSYPNPFNAVTQIKYQLAQPAEVTLVIYDILGRQAESIAMGMQQAGQHAYIWDADDFSSGTYFARICIANNSDVIKLTLLK